MRKLVVGCVVLLAVAMSAFGAEDVREGPDIGAREIVRRSSVGMG